MIERILEFQASAPALPIQGFALKYVYPLFAVLLVLEFAKARELFDLRETAASAIMGIGATVVRVSTSAAEIALYYWIFQASAEWRTANLGYSSLGYAWYIWVACLLLDDHNFYWHHRLTHNIRLLWAAHEPHHSGEKFNLTISIRNGWFVAFFKFAYWMWLPLVGFEPIMIATCLIANGLYQFFLHSQLVPHLPKIEKVFNTAYVHVVHHSSNDEYLDRNHGGILTVWDRLYGTWQDPIAGIKPAYGIRKKLDTTNVWTHHIFEFQDIWADVKAAPDFKSKWMYVFGPPGWSHDGRTKTARQIREEAQTARGAPVAGQSGLAAAA